MILVVLIVIGGGSRVSFLEFLDIVCLRDEEEEIRVVRVGRVGSGRIEKYCKLKF